MKWLRTIIVFDQGNIVSSSDWSAFHDSYAACIKAIDHPRGTGKFTLREKLALPDGQWVRNGVPYLRSEFLNHMVGSTMWRAEGMVGLEKTRDQPVMKLYPSLQDHREEITSNFGGFDFVTTGPQGTRIAIEWETGNISSSHRSMNKLAIALSSSIIDVGVLIVPSRALYEHLTDRIGNIGELSGYLALWEGLKTTVKRGLLAITVVEHDELSVDPKIPHLRAGADGRARKKTALAPKTLKKARTIQSKPLRPKGPLE